MRSGAGWLSKERQRERALTRLRKLRNMARAEIDRLLEFLDASDLDPDLEPVGDDEPSLCGVDVRPIFSDQDLEPDLGSFDRMVDQTKSTRTTKAAGVTDGEVDDCDREDDDPAEDDPSGIADYDGLLEQCPSIYRHGERVE